MKKIMILVAVVLMVAAGSIGVFAVDEAVSSNMTAERFLELRLSQIDQALKDGKITEEQANDLRVHIKEVAEKGIFGQRRNGEGNPECVLGEDGNLGLFRNANSGQKMGNGNGQGIHKADGTGRGNGGKGLRNGNCTIE
jgi:hypothetical protein